MRNRAMTLIAVAVNAIEGTSVQADIRLEAIDIDDSARAGSRSSSGSIRFRFAPRHREFRWCWLGCRSASPVYPVRSWAGRVA
jgi:hypothetical protein